MRSPRIASLFPLAPALLGVLTISLLAGCGGGGGGGNGNNNTGTTTTTSTNNTAGTTSGSNTGASANSVSTTTASGLIATLSEPSATVGVGGTVVYTLTIRNPTGAAISIQAIPPPPSVPTTPAVTLVVRDAANNKVYDPVPIPPALNVSTLAPGQSLSTTVAISAFAARGTYTATANFAETIPATPVGPLKVTAQ